MKNAILTGLGGRGLYWLNVLRQRDDVQVVAFAEPFQGSINRAVDDFSVPREQIFGSLEEAIANSNADFVLDVTPPAVHHEVAFKAFDAGLHVLGEKPLSDDFESAKKVAAAGAKKGLRHMITQNYRFTAQPRTTRPLIESGKIGQVGQVDVHFTMNWADIPGSHYVTQPYMMINDMMVHHFDLIRYVTGQDPISVQAVTWNQPWGWHKGDACHSIVFKFASGLVATHVALGCEVGQTTSWNGDWHIAGSGGSIDWDTQGLWFSHTHKTENVVSREEIAQLEVKDGAQAITDEFLAAIEENRAPECSAQDNLKSLAMVFAAIQSAKEGRVVQLGEI